MLREASEIYEKHIVVDNSKIFFKRDTQNKTLSTYLRDESLSAMILDTNRNVIGTYGLYASLVGEKTLESLAKKSDLDKALLEGKTPFNFYQLRDKRSHLVMSYPIIKDEEVVGVIILASDLNFGPEAVMVVVSILLLILVASIAMGWVFTYITVSKQFRPLQRILDEMNNYEIGEKPTEYELRGNPSDELVRLSKAFKALIFRIHEGNQKQKEFIANASHELKTPLANSVLSLDLASMDLAEKKYKKAKTSIEIVKNDLKRFGGLIDSLLEIARIGKIENTVKVITISEIIEEIVSSHKRSIAEDVNIKVVVAKNVQINFPENHLRIILSNLIGNAIKYTRVGGKINVELKVSDKAEIVVENETVNLKKSDLQKIWRRNERLEFFKKIKGNGIGLYLIKEIAEHHNLTIKQSLRKGIFRVIVSGFFVREV